MVIKKNELGMGALFSRSVLRGVICLLVFLMVLATFVLLGCKKALSSSAQASDKNLQTIIVVGKATVLEGGNQNAFESAKEHGFRMAIEKVVGTSLLSETTVKDGTLLRDDINARAVGFIENYQIKQEKNSVERINGQEVTTKELEMEVRVRRKKLEDHVLAMRALQSRLNLPIIAIRIIDANSDSGDASERAKNVDFGLAEKLYSEAATNLLTRQFYLTTNAQAGKASFIDQLQIENETGQAPLGLTTEAEAEIFFDVYVGVSRVEIDEALKSIFGNETKGLSSIDLQIAVRILDGSSGQVLLSGNRKERGIAIGLEAATYKAAEKTADFFDKMASKLLSKGVEELDRGRDIVVTISGVNQQKRKKLLGQITPRRLEGVKAVFDKNWSEQTMRLVIRYLHSPTQLAAMLTAKETEMDDLELLSIGKSAIHIKKK